MCRSIRPLFNFDPPATDTEIHEAALQFVRKVSGMRTPSQKNAAAFNQGVTDIEAVIRQLLSDLETTSPPKNRETEAAKRKAQSARRFGR